MAEVNGRAFSEDLLRSVFHLLDAGGTRASVRSLVKDAQGRGISNETVAALRDSHLRLRRSQGYAIGPRQRRNLRATPDSPIVRLRDVAPRFRLNPKRIPAPPRIEGLRYQQVVRYDLPDGGTEIRVFSIGDDQASIAGQVHDAQQRSGFGSTAAEAPVGGRGYEVLATLPEVEDL